MTAIQAPRFDPVRESMGIAEGMARLPLHWFEMPWLPRGNGAPVLVMPGFMAGDGSTAVLRGFLRTLGYRVHGWGLGRNGGDVLRLRREMTAKVEELNRTHGGPVRLIGWSLGGVVAREVARARPDLVHSVITMGTPVLGGPKYTAVASMYGRMFGQDMDTIERLIAANNKRPIKVPVTAMYTRNDSVVAWEACIDPDGTHIEHIDVGTTHLGFGFNPDVFRIIARRLGRNADS